MTWKNVLDKYIRIKSIAGVEICLMPDKSLLLNAVIVRLQGDLLIKGTEYINISNRETLFQHLPKDIPVALNISGKGILHRPASNDKANIIPGMNENDFYFQPFSCKDQQEVALVRQQQLDEMISLFSDNGYKVVGAGIGLSYSAGLSAHIKTERGAAVNTTTFSLQLARQELTGYTSMQEAGPSIIHPEILIGDQSVKSNLLPAFAVAAHALLDGFQDGLIIQETISGNKKELRYQRLFNFVGVGSLTVIFLILLINFLLFQHYYTLAQQTSNNHELYQKKLNNFDTLQQQIHKKEQFLETIGWTKQTIISEIADKIAMSVPEEVTLQTLTIFPLSDQTKGGDMPRFQKDTVLVGGTCNTPWLLNDWINDLQQTDIIASAKLLTYWYKKEDETGQFQIELVLK
ncbi:hypothetical protein [Chitinophaga sp. HK235]|uniref:hypothetical protein n=1 Tax=Chitinophaga sp. HK235 TaxID=2952571 RepID=UPI001BA82A59|nr:hypothetical protein [Chitinophaga sp. HK235]